MISLERATHPREGVPQRATLITGVVTRRFDVPVTGAAAVVGVKFRPGGLAHLLGATAQNWTDQTINADAVLPPEVAEGFAGLEPAALQDHGLGKLDQALIGLIDRSVDRNEERYDLLLRIVSDMLADRTVVTVGQISARYGVAERTLQRWFGSYVGVGPKWVLGRYRMHDVVSEIDAGYSGPLTELAHRYGWYDQSHSIRDFKSLVGVSPSDYVTRRNAPTFSDSQ
jgi:AraC-like DNA-binding protein